MDGIWDWLTSGFGGGTGGGVGGGLTPDQQQMQTQQGWYPRPDMVMPTGQSMQQPPGYSNLSPAQAAMASPQTGIGYFTGAPGDTGSQDQSLWDKVKSVVAGDPAQTGIGNLQNALGTPQPRQNLAPPPPLQHPAGLLNPLHNVYTPPQFDPKQNLLRFQRGY
jgi:hypothetical protein